MVSPTRRKDANFYIRGFTMSTTDNYFDEEAIGLYKKVKVTLEKHKKPVPLILASPVKKVPRLIIGGLFLLTAIDYFFEIFVMRGSVAGDSLSSNAGTVTLYLLIYFAIAALFLLGPVIFKGKYTAWKKACIAELGFDWEDEYHAPYYKRGKKLVRRHAAGAPQREREAIARSRAAGAAAGGPAPSNRSKAKVTKQLKKVGLACPKCGSTNVQLFNDTRKTLSAGKAFVGGAVAGPAGMAIGAAMGKKGKREYVCLACGKRYSVNN